MDNQPILDAIDPEYVERLAARKQDIEQGAWARPGIVAALALGSVPIALAALSRDAYGQSSLPTAVKSVFDFALALEIFENEFYLAVLGNSKYAAYNTAFATVRAQVPANALATIQQIQKHEQAHVNTLLSVGATDVFNLQATATNGQFDFTGARGAGNGPFAKATTNLGFLLEVAQGAEDTGVRAYKGQAGVLLAANADKLLLENALRIHSVEARHASRIRRIRRSLNTGVTAIRYSGTVRGGDAAAAGGTDLGDTATVQAQVTAAFNKIYGAGANSTTAPNESNTTHAGVNVANLANANFGVEAAQEAFDEPLDRADVVAIVQPFFIPTIS